MKAYKGFNKDLTCRGYKFEEGKIFEENEANCVKNGFHCAENPLDCFTYYPQIENSAYYIIEAFGDLDEDGTDSKISCTKMQLVQRMTLEKIMIEALVFMVKKPYRKIHHCVKNEEGNAKNGFAIVRGKNPKAKGKIGDVLALAKEEKDSVKIIDAAVGKVGINAKPDTWYMLENGRIKEVKEK